MDTEKRWYAVYTHSRAEKKVSAFLKELGVEQYLPLVKTLRQWSDRKKLVNLPLFRSYIFVRVNNQDYTKVLTVPGVVCYVSIAGKKVPIPDFQIDAVRVYLGEMELKSSMEFFSEGDEIEVAYGPLRGLKGTLIEVKNTHKLMVRVDAINQSLTLTLPHNLVRILRKHYA